MKPRTTHSRRRLIFLNRYFSPDDSASSQMMSGVAFGLAEQGWSVAVITSRSQYSNTSINLPAFELVRGVEIHRIWTSRFGRRGTTGRLVDYLTFYAASALALWRLGRSGDIFVAKTDPPMLSVVALPIARLKQAFLVNWLQDLFPEIAGRLGLGRGGVGRFAFGRLRALRNTSLLGAQANVVIGEHMQAYLLGLGVSASKIRLIPNWADGDLLRPLPHAENPKRAQWAQDGEILVAYSGNLGRAHDYETIIEAIALVERGKCDCGEPDFHAARARRISWLFIGGGANYEALRKDAVARNLKSVRFEPYQPADQLAASLSAADIHLVSLRPELEGLVVPSKIYGIAAAGRPTIFIGSLDGEIARLINSSQSGLTISSGDSAALAEAVATLAHDAELRNALGENSRTAFEHSFSLPIALSRWNTLFSGIGSKDVKSN